MDSKEVYILVQWDDGGYKILDVFEDKELAKQALEVYTVGNSELEILTFGISNGLPNTCYNIVLSVSPLSPNYPHISVFKEHLSKADPLDEFIEDNRGMFDHNCEALLNNGNTITMVRGVGSTKVEATEDAYARFKKYTDPNHPLRNTYTYYRIFLNWHQGKKYHGMFTNAEPVFVNDGSKFEDILAKHEAAAVKGLEDLEINLIHGFWGVGMNEAKAKKDAERLKDLILSKKGLL